MENYDIDLKEANAIEIRELTEKSFVGGLDGLLRILTKTMVKKWATANEIAKMQKHICAQFGIDVGEEFINVTERSEIEKEYQHFNAYFAECIVPDATKRTETARVYKDYLDWTKSRESSVFLTKNRFYKLLRNAGITKGKSGGMWYFRLSIVHNG